MLVNTPSPPVALSPDDVPEDYITYSVRVPKSLVKMIDARAKIKRVSRNKETVHLLEYAIDHAVHMDNQMVDQLQAAGY